MYIQWYKHVHLNLNLLKMHKTAFSKIEKVGVKWFNVEYWALSELHNYNCYGNDLHIQLKCTHTICVFLHTVVHCTYTQLHNMTDCVHTYIIRMERLTLFDASLQMWNGIISANHLWDSTMHCLVSNQTSLSSASGYRLVSVSANRCRTPDAWLNSVYH